MCMAFLAYIHRQSIQDAVARTDYQKNVQRLAEADELLEKSEYGIHKHYVKKSLRILKPLDSTNAKPIAYYFIISIALEYSIAGYELNVHLVDRDKNSSSVPFDYSILTWFRDAAENLETYQKRSKEKKASPYIKMVTERLDSLALLAIAKDKQMPGLLDKLIWNVPENLNSLLIDYSLSPAEWVYSRLRKYNSPKEDTYRGLLLVRFMNLALLLNLADADELRKFIMTAPDATLMKAHRAGVVGKKFFLRPDLGGICAVLHKIPNVQESLHKFFSPQKIPSREPWCKGSGDH